MSATGTSVIADQMALRGNPRTGNEPVRLNGITKDCLRFCSLIVGKRARVVVFYPYSTIEISVLVALESLYQVNYIKSFSRQKVLLLTDRQTRTEAFYLGLQLSGSPLSSIFGFGHGATARSQKGLPKRAPENKFILANPRSASRIERLDGFALIVLAVNTAWGLDKVSMSLALSRRGGIPTLVVLEPWNRVRKIRQYNEMLFHFYSWRSEEISRDDQRPESTASSSGPHDPAGASTIGLSTRVLPRDWSYDLFEESKTILHSLFSSDHNRELVGLVYGILRDFQKLAVPVTLYDSACMGSFFRKPIAIRLRQLREQVESIPLEQPASELRRTTLLLNELYDELKTKGNQKHEIFLQELRRAIVNSRPSVFMFSNVQERNAFERSLSHLSNPIPSDLLSRVGISIGSYDSIPQQEGSSNTIQVFLSTYPPLNRMDTIVDWLTELGSNVVLILRKQEAEKFEFYAKDAETVRNFVFSSESKVQTIRELVTETPPHHYDLPRTAPIEIEEPKPEAEAMPQGPTEDLLRILLEFEETGAVSSPYVRTSGGTSEQAATTQGLLVHLAEGGVLPLRSSKYVNVYVEGGGIRIVRASNLKPGNILVLVNMSVRKSLNELILERASQYPKFRILEELVRKWIRGLREGMAGSADSSRVLLSKLQGKGSAIKTPEAIHFWRMGLVMGPRDFEDIRRLAQIYSKKELEDNFQGISTAIKEFRHLRREILHALKQSLLQRQNTNLAKIGINLDDFSDAIEFATVKEITENERIGIDELNRVGGLSV